MEGIVRKRILSFHDSAGVIPKEQHGFLSGASTTTNLVDTVYDISYALNGGKSVDMIYIDLSKAFDRVSHSKLLHCVARLGLDVEIVRWLRSYLHNRHMTVKVGNAFSDRCRCVSGVPQGAALSPLLFLIYTLELPHLLITSPSIRVQMFADDIKIYGIYDVNDCDAVRAALKASLLKLPQWASLYEIPINLDKCKLMHFGGGAPTRHEIGGHIVERCFSFNDLGVIFEPTLSFNKQIDKLCCKAYASLFLIFRNIKSSDPMIFIHLYSSYVLPHLEYGSQVWNPCTTKSIAKIEKVQHVFTRLLWCRCLKQNPCDKTPSYHERLKLFSLPSLQSRRIAADLIFCLHILRGRSKLKMSKYWSLVPSSCRIGDFNLQYSRICKKNYSVRFNNIFCRFARWVD